MRGWGESCKEGSEDEACKRLQHLIKIFMVGTVNGLGLQFANSKVWNATGQALAVLLVQQAKRVLRGIVMVGTGYEL